MSINIDVVYLDGEVVLFRNHRAVPGEKYPLLLSNHELQDVVLRFCAPDGAAVEVLPPEEFGGAQILLTYRDRLLLSREENIFFRKSVDGFQQLEIVSLQADSVEIRNVLAESCWELEPHYRGWVECDFSCAIYACSDHRAIQLFFTMPCKLSEK